MLECRGGASVGFIVGSVTNLGCVLRADGLPEDRYVATIRKVGIDLGITQESSLAWVVYAPVERIGPGDLSGDYAGAQGSASVGVGVGGNVLVGGSANSIALQPLSVQGQVGAECCRGPGKPGTPAGPVVSAPLVVCSAGMWREAREVKTTMTCGGARTAVGADASFLTSNNPQGAAGPPG